MIIVTMITFDKYPLCDIEKDEAAVGSQAPEKMYNNETKPSTAKKLDEDDIDGDENNEKPQKINSEPTKINGGDPQEPTRGKMASVFISGFFMIIVICFIYAAWIQASLSEVQDMVIAIIGALSGLVGFVIGYYFKTTSK